MGHWADFFFAFARLDAVEMLSYIRMKKIVMSTVAAVFVLFITQKHTDSRYQGNISPCSNRPDEN